MSSIVEQGLGVGDVISLLWFKRSLPRYCTRFIEVSYYLKFSIVSFIKFDFFNWTFISQLHQLIWHSISLVCSPYCRCYSLEQICIMLCADHGPCVSGAHNTIVTARAGKDLVSSLVSGMSITCSFLLNLLENSNNFEYT